MRTMILALAILYPAAAFAQGTTAPAPAGEPPTVGGKPLVVVGSKKSAGKKKSEAPAKPQSVAQKLQACLDIDDATKERLTCYDAIFAPQPKPNFAPMQVQHDMEDAQRSTEKTLQQMRSRGR